MEVEELGLWLFTPTTFMHTSWLVLSPIHTVRAEKSSWDFQIKGRDVLTLSVAQPPTEQVWAAGKASLQCSLYSS